MTARDEYRQRRHVRVTCASRARQPVRHGARRVRRAQHRAHTLRPLGEVDACADVQRKLVLASDDTITTDDTTKDD